MPAGRPKIPTKITQLRGNPGKRKLNDAEPQYDSKIPECPKHLKYEAKKEWQRITKLLSENDLITEVDLVALTLYCSAWGNFVEAEKKLANRDEWVTQLESGYQVANAYFQIRNNAWKELKTICYEFGFTPSSRAKLTVGKPKEPDEEVFTNFLNQNKK